MMNRLPTEWVDRIFMRLHGQVWAEELAGISPNRIKNALLHNYDYAPSCDQFKDQCKSTIEAHRDFVGLPRKFTAEEREANRKRLQTTLDSLNIKRLN